jgi:SAM-dependent methyltransferase
VAEHWRGVYEKRAIEELSWTEEVPAASLAAIAAAVPNPTASILDVGGGASRLAAELLALGYEDLTVADISAAAMERAKAGLGPEAARVKWVEANLRSHDFGRRFDLWHDRAVFHFMVEPADRDGYLEVLARTLRPGGDLVLATFGSDGPTECSGRPVDRHDAESLVRVLGPHFTPVSSRLVEHTTPSGRTQQFLYARFRYL